MSGAELATSVLVLAGAALAVVAGIGLQRFPDVFARMHAATKPATLGLVLVAAGSAIALDTTGDVAKLGLVVVLQFVTAPVAAHMVGRAAYRAGTELSPGTEVDELAEAESERRPHPHPEPGAADDGNPTTAAPDPAGSTRPGSAGPPQG